METFLPPAFGKEMQPTSHKRGKYCLEFQLLLSNRRSFLLSQDTNSKKEFYFSTRDLLIMTVLAALGGVASTYINTISDAVQAAIGFAGGSQWAAGLHVIWIVLSVGILRKPGTGTITGIIKGAC